MRVCAPCYAYCRKCVALVDVSVFRDTVTWDVSSFWLRTSRHRNAPYIGLRKPKTEAGFVS